MKRCGNCFELYDEDLGICPFCGYVEGEAPEPGDCLPPRTILQDRYEIGMVVGRGGFGIIYRAWDRKLKIVVAIKEYFPSGAASRSPAGNNAVVPDQGKSREFSLGKSRGLLEARSMAKFIHHENIVNVLDYFEENNTVYIIMEFMEGRTLGQILQASAVPLPYQECVRIACDICHALRSIHAENILHRDVSPDNIMVCDNGATKLFDFGAALFEVGRDSRGPVVLKPGFAPPEQYDRSIRQDQRTDLYALGATMYYAMTGCCPEESPRRRQADHLRAPSELDESIPDDTSKVVMRAMELNQGDRFQSAAAFEQALQSIPKSGPKRKGGQDIRRADSPNGAKKLRTAVIVGAAALAAIVAGLFLSGTLGGGAQETAGESTYEVVLSTASWTEAESLAREAGGCLVRIDSQEEWETLQSLLTDYQDKYLWIGLRRTPPSEEYFWIDGPDGSAPSKGAASLLPSLWVEGEPSYSYEERIETCGELRYQTDQGQWGINDATDDLVAKAGWIAPQMGYIIEYEGTGGGD